MPTYDYQCEACGHEFEKFQSITAPAVRKCPECKKMKVKRLIGTGAGIIFKGSGFYQTDYRGSDYKKAAEKDNAAKSSDTSGKTKSESQPAKTESTSATTTDG
jgi:putative FmdB family regulatory protein